MRACVRACACTCMCVIMAVVAKGDCDLVGLGRPLCVVPDGPEKILSGVVDKLPEYENTLQLGVCMCE